MYTIPDWEELRLHHFAKYYGQWWDAKIFGNLQDFLRRERLKKLLNGEQADD